MKSAVKTITCAFSALLLLTLNAVQSPAQNGRTSDAARHSSDASEVFTKVMGVKEKAIPKELLDKAEAIAVFPGVVKVAFGIGGKGGQGVVSRRIQHGWSEPVFFNIGGASIGAQIGASKTDYVLLIMNDDGLNSLLKDKVELGGEVGVAAGPLGREAAASTDALLTAGILSYSRSKGAFIGAALKGAVISPDNDLNQAFYGKKAKDLLTGKLTTIADMPSAVKIFPRTLSRYSAK
jgi:lipid-binding SYLF domain-containing protein